MGCDPVDEIDALAIARAVVKDGVEDFPVAHLDAQAMEIRLLSDHRRVKARAGDRNDVQRVVELPVAAAAQAVAITLA